MPEVLAPDEIALQTKQKRQIKNQIALDNPPEILRHAVEDWGGRHPNAHLRSITSTYNCIGLVVASRRALVDPDQLMLALTDDGYRQIVLNEVRPGDVVIYRRNGRIQHAGIVVNLGQVEAQPRLVLCSKWGEAGEYVHEIDDVPTIYGQATEYWTDRKTLG